MKNSQYLNQTLKLISELADRAKSRINEDPDLSLIDNIIERRYRDEIGDNPANVKVYVGKKNDGIVNDNDPYTSTKDDTEEENDAVSSLKTKILNKSNKPKDYPTQIKSDKKRNPSLRELGYIKKSVDYDAKDVDVVPSRIENKNKRKKPKSNKSNMFHDVALHDYI